MGIEPVNPIGQCFDSVGFQILSSKRRDWKVCHGIGVANMPGQEGNVIQHAWIEDDKWAYDTTWGVRAEKWRYRKGLKIYYAVEYSRDEFILKWIETDFPGPWDKRIIRKKETK